MAFGRQVDDAVHFLLLHQFEHAFEVADVHLHELVVGLVLNVLEIGQIARISELIQVDDLVLRVLVHKQTDYVRANEAGPAGDDEGSFHRKDVFN